MDKEKALFENLKWPIIGVNHFSLHCGDKIVHLSGQ
jgi:hypothetical protein